MSFDIKQATSHLLDEIQALPLDGKPNELYEPIRYMLSLGGKRMRPILALIGCYLFDDDFLKALKPAVAVETFHNFTLLHDDLMDNAPLRRGKTTVHEKWDNNVAILSGDVMLVKAYQVLMEMKHEKLHDIIKLFNQCACEVCEGQQLDMNYESAETVTEDEYINMIRLKTAVLLGTSLQIGALTGGAPLEESKKLYDFGVNLGIGFQLKDDLLDVYGDQAKFGKQVGGDIIANKKTYLLIKALELAKGSQAELLNHWLSLKEFDASQKVDAVKSIYNQLNIRQLSEEQMNDFFKKSFDLVQKIELPLAKKQVLLSFANEIINREK